MTKVTSRQSLPALDNSKSVKNPDLLNIADKNYASTILRYSNLAILYAQLETKDKHIVGAINEVNARTQPAKRVGETDVVGGVIIGDGLTVTEEGVLSANAQGLTPATADKLGGIMVGENLSITEEGVLSADAQELEPATADTLGGIKLGDYLSITSDGTLSVESSAVGKTYYPGVLTNISNENEINVNMTKSTVADIEQDSRDNPNVLFFTEGNPSGGKSYYSGVLTTIDSNNNINVNMTRSTVADIQDASIQSPNTLFYTVGVSSNAIYTTVVTLASGSWDSTNNQQLALVRGVGSDSVILVAPVSDSTSNFDNYCSAGIRAIAQSANTITFKCSTIPSTNISVNITYWENPT